MPVTLTDPSQLLARHQARFAAVLAKAEELMVEAAYDQFAETVEQFSGNDSQPQGDSRREWLRSERPFSKYSFDKPHFSPAAPNPVGIISGELLNSLSYDMFTSSLGYFKAVSYSQGVDYAKYLIAPQGTEYMVPRLVRQHMDEWARNRLHRVIIDIVAFQRSLY